MEKYKPIWPKTVMFWGAGATVSLGFMTTRNLGQFFSKLCIKCEGETFYEITKDKDTNKSLQNLFKFLDPSVDIDDINDELSEEFNSDGKERVKELREYYDWDSLKKIMKVVLILKMIKWNFRTYLI